MESKKIKCTSKKHKDINAIFYCVECKLYLCNKCQKHHSELFENHHQYKIDTNFSEIFTGFCKVQDHCQKLIFYCKNHNQLCCAACVTKIKDKIYGQHADCEVCFIQNIKEEKKNKLEENIKSLEELSNSLENNINKLKNILITINENKDKLKLKIQNIFIKIRNELNERENIILLEVDKKFNDLYIKDELIKESEKLKDKIRISLDKGKIIDKEWMDDNKLNLLINDCIDIENNIKNIKLINENMKYCNSFDLKFNFEPEKDEEINKFIETIKTFGNIISIKFKFKKCPLNISEERKYSISGEFENILTKTGSDYNWMGTICENKLENSEENKWKIKILKSKFNNIMVGVAPLDFDINISSFDKYGWYFRVNDKQFFSGPPHNYYPYKKKEKKKRKYSSSSSDSDKERKEKKYEIILIMNIKNRTLKFIVNNKNINNFYSEIPIDKPLTPAVFLYNKDDSVEIIDV